MRRMVLRRGWLGLAALVALAISGPRAGAGCIISGPVTTEGLGAFTGFLDVTTVDADTATLTITLTNTSDPANGGYITAFVFNNPDDLITGATLAPPAPPGENFGLDFSNDGIDANPFGNFDFLISTGGQFEGGGAPSAGLGVGETGTFVLTLTGDGVGALTQESFETAFNTGANQNFDNQFFVVRFRGFEDGGSDKVGAISCAVPEPATMLAAGSGLLLLGLARLRRRRGA